MIVAAVLPFGEALWWRVVFPLPTNRHLVTRCEMYLVKRFSITVMSTNCIRKLPKHTRYKHVGDERGGLRLQNGAAVLFESHLGETR